MRFQSEPRYHLLFSGYAPVHFACFRPIYRALLEHPQIEIHLSGGVPVTNEKGIRVYDPKAMYRPFRLRKPKIVPLAEIARRRYELVFCAHVSGFFPKSERGRVQIFHGLSFRNMAVRRDVLVFDHLFITGPYMMRAFQENQLLRKNDPRCIPIGFPKVDRLVDGSLDRDRIRTSLGLTGRRPVVLYAPTGLKENSLETGRGEAVVKRLKSTGHYDLLIKLHDHSRGASRDWPAVMRGYVDAHTRLIRDPDIVPYLYAADLLLTDASSVSSEYCLLDRPMVFIDVPELLEAVRKKGNALDLETWGRRGGITANWPDEIVEAVGSALRHPNEGSPVRRAMAKDLFYNPGRATQAAVHWILDFLGLPRDRRTGPGGRTP